MRGLLRACAGFRPVAVRSSALHVPHRAAFMSKEMVCSQRARSMQAARGAVSFVAPPPSACC